MLIFLNIRRSLAHRGPYSTAAAIARAEEYDRVQASDVGMSPTASTQPRAVHFTKWAAGVLLALSALITVGSLIFGALATGEQKIDIGFTLVTITGVLVLAALPLLAISRTSE